MRLRRIVRLVLAIALLQGSNLLSVAAFAATPTQITSCPATISSAGFYQVQGNLSSTGTLHHDYRVRRDAEPPGESYR